MPTENSKSLLDTIQSKIAELIDDFRNGEISREQFNIVYTRYHKQLDLAYRAAKEDMKENVSDAATFRLDDMRMDKATGIAIYHHKSNSTIASLGNYAVASDTVNPILTEIAEKIDHDALVEARVEQLDNGQWLLCITDSATSAIVIFKAKPNPYQIMVFEHILHDFEAANRHLLEKTEIDSEKLAQPFMPVVKSTK